MKLKVYCQHEDFANKLNFYIFQDNPDGSRDICISMDKMEFKHCVDGEPIPITFSLSGHVTTPFLQAMANTLKKIGIKADEEPILENELSAVRYHLEDMRKLVFKEMIIKKELQPTSDVPVYDSEKDGDAYPGKVIVRGK